MAQTHLRLTHVRRGFLTVWALFFMVAMSSLVLIVMAGQVAQQQTTDRLIQQYNQTTERLTQHRNKRTNGHRHCPGVGHNHCLNKS